MFILHIYNATILIGTNLLLWECERHVYSDRVRLMWLTSFPAGPKSKRWQCSLRNVSWRTTWRRRHQLSAVWLLVISHWWGCVSAYFLWLSVSVIPCADTLKWTTVDAGGGSMESVCIVAFWTAWCPVSDSSATEPRYHTLHATQRQKHTEWHARSTGAE